MVDQSKFGGIGSREQFTSWAKGAPPDEAIHAAVQTLARIGQLDTTQRQRFYDEVRTDPQAMRLLEDLKATV
jgi:hypothetical protein